MGRGASGGTKQGRPSYQTISKDRGAKLNLRKLVVKNAEAIIAISQKGIPYRLIAEEIGYCLFYIVTEDQSRHHSAWAQAYYRMQRDKGKAIQRRCGR